MQEGPAAGWQLCPALDFCLVIEFCASLVVTLRAVGGVEEGPELSGFDPVLFQSPCWDPQSSSTNSSTVQTS